LWSFWAYCELIWTILTQVITLGVWHMPKNGFWNISAKTVNKFKKIKIFLESTKKSANLEFCFCRLLQSPCDFRVPLKVASFWEPYAKTIWTPWKSIAHLCLCYYCSSWVCLWAFSHSHWVFVAVECRCFYK